MAPRSLLSKSAEKEDSWLQEEHAPCWSLPGFYSWR